MPIYTSYPKNEYDLLKKEIDAALKKVLKRGVYILGEEVERFEQEFAEYIGAVHCIGVSSGTDALFLALKALGIGPGDEVITTSFTAAFTAFAVVYTGAKPVFVDINPDTYNIDELAIEQVISKRTKAIIPVHLFGQPANIKKIVEVARRNRLYVVEDACQAHGAKVGNKQVGTFGDIACFSFYPTKNLGAIGDGGAIVTDNKRIADKVRLLRNGHQTKKYYHTATGYNCRLDELQAAILRVKLRYVEGFIEERRTIAGNYNNLITAPHIIKPFTKNNVRHVVHLYVIRTPKRNQLLKLLAKNNIFTQVHYPWPIHKLPAFKILPELSLPVSEMASKQVLSLPVYPGLSSKDIKKIIDIINNWGMA